MNETSSPLAQGALSLVALRACGVTPLNIDNQWMDDMVDRLFVELKRELSQLENAKPTTDATERAQNARTLDSLQRTLERLNRMKVQRAAHSDPAEKPAETRARLKPRLVGIARRAGRDPGGADG